MGLAHIRRKDHRDEWGDQLLEKGAQQHIKQNQQAEADRQETSCQESGSQETG